MRQPIDPLHAQEQHPSPLLKTYRACVIVTRDRLVQAPLTWPHQSGLTDQQLLDIGRTVRARRTGVEVPSGTLEVVDMPLRDLVPGGQAVAPAANILANFGALCSTAWVGDMFLPVSRVTAQQLDQILAVELHGVRPHLLKMGQWLEETKGTRTKTYLHSRNGRPGISVRSMLIEQVAEILALHLGDPVNAREAAEDKAAGIELDIARNQ